MPLLPHRALVLPAKTSETFGVVSTFAYDKAGNRTSYQHQNGGGQNYGLACNYNSYSYDAMGRLTAIQDTGRSFTAAVTNDWNGNITEVA